MTGPASLLLGYPASIWAFTFACLCVAAYAIVRACEQGPRRW